eukprot:UN30407
MLHLIQQNYPERELVGYYTAGPDVDIKKPKPFKFPVTKSQGWSKKLDYPVTATAYPCCYMVWKATNKKTTAKNLPVRLYRTKSGAVKESVKFNIDRERQAELIALTDVLKLECNRTSLSKLERYDEGVNHLL